MSFDSAAAAYDAARPSYPERIYAILETNSGGLARKVVGDGGAGTGVVSRSCSERQADVIAFDPGVGILRRAQHGTRGLRALVAEAGAIPLRAHLLDLLCFGQSWHWVDQKLGASEAARVLRSKAGGRHGGIIPGPILKSGSTPSVHSWRPGARATHADHGTSTGVLNPLLPATGFSRRNATSSPGNIESPLRTNSLT
jgi:Methyltransferase domain